MCRILSTGCDHYLMAVRSMLLRHSGYSVKEAYSSEETLQLMQSEKIDLLLICHTLTLAEHARLVIEIRKKQKRLPVICLTAREGESYADCINVTNSPGALLEAVRLAELSLQGALETAA